MFFKLQNYNKPVKKPDVNEKFVYESRFNDKTNEFNMFVGDVIASNFKLSNEIAKKVTLQKFVEDRVKYYLGDMYDKQIVYPNNDYINVDVLANDMDSTRKKYPKGIFKHGIYTGTICKMTHFGLKVIDKAGLTGYTKRFLPYFSILNVPNKYFLYLIGDVEINDDDYFFTKIRLSECKKGVILKASNLQRHWGPLYSREVFENDIPYEQKKNVALWRGATTGQPNRPANRFDLVEKYFDNNNNMDIAFSNTAYGTVDTSGNMINYQSYKKYVKGKMSITEQLKYKYLISVDGNDKSSALNWMLASNSVVMMAKPKNLSWLMEDRLIPYVHYIELKDDFSDLEEKIQWCETHQQECKQIVNNSNAFMSQFYFEKGERYIESQVIKRYLDKVNFSKVNFSKVNQVQLIPNRNELF